MGVDPCHAGVVGAVRAAHSHRREQGTASKLGRPSTRGLGVVCTGALGCADSFSPFLVALEIAGSHLDLAAVAGLCTDQSVFGGRLLAWRTIRRDVWLAGLDKRVVFQFLVCAGPPADARSNFDCKSSPCHRHQHVSHGRGLGDCLSQNGKPALSRVGAHIGGPVQSLCRGVSEYLSSTRIIYPLK